MFEDLKLRSISASFLLILLIFFSFMTPNLLKYALYIVHFFLLRELFRIHGFKQRTAGLDVLFLVICISPSFFAQSYLTLSFILSISLYLFVNYKSRSRQLSLFFIYINLSISFLLSVLVSDSILGGINFFLIFVMTVALSDIGGYFGGRFFGGRKVYEKISPGKTWSGIISGWITVIFFYLILKISGYYTSDVFFLLFIGIAVFSQIGDLIESYMKRNLGIKDTGDIIPGHGGLLDRCDGLIGASFFLKAAELYLVI
ncbi:phosphatidate cytidylyltransferase [Paracoccaceae bacterium]|nr:phosphatidate cytidylyltransferase [Paracoccaceae bacterium]